MKSVRRSRCFSEGPVMRTIREAQWLLVRRCVIINNWPENKAIDNATQ
jgi:hypothetical protein